MRRRNSWTSSAPWTEFRNALVSEMYLNTARAVSSAVRACLRVLDAELGVSSGLLAFDCHACPVVLDTAGIWPASAGPAGSGDGNPELCMTAPSLRESTSVA